MSGHGQEFRLGQADMRRAFEAAARDYDAAAVLQREVGARLLERLELMALSPTRILDLGCGTGGALRALRKRYPGAEVWGVDIACNMLRVARRAQGWWRRARLVCADARHLPLPAGCAELIFSNLMLQWCDDLDGCLLELRRVLRPHSLLLFSSFGPDTLKELRSAWSAVDGYTHVHRFLDMHDIGDALVRAGFAEPVMDVEHLTLTYTGVPELMRDLKRIGAHNVSAGRRRGLTGRGRLQKLMAAYEPLRRDGRLPLTYEVVYGIAWTPSFIPLAAFGGTT